MTSSIQSSSRVRATRGRLRQRALAGGSIPALLLAIAPIGAAHAQRVAAVGDASACPWLNTSLPIAARVNMLLGKMTIADEIGLVQGNGSANPYVFYVKGNPSLCIPNLGFEDGPEGVADGLTDVTQLPASIALAATFSKTLAFQYGAVIGAEQTTKGSAADLGPTVNIDRDPRWGRTFESLSEDPTLSSQIGTSEIIGLQSQRLMAQVKHFDAYNQETNRNNPADDVIVSDRVLHEIYEPSFDTAIHDGGAATVMCAYSTVNGEYSCQNGSLLTGVLRNQYDLQGLVMSDYGAIHDISAATAGTGFEQPENTYFGTPLLSAVTEGSIPRAVLNAMVEPLLYDLFRFNLLNSPPAGSTGAIATSPAHASLADTVAEAGSVLLRNRGALLPLSASDDVAVIGPAASTQLVSGGGGSAHVDPPSVATPLAAIQSAATGSVTYAQGLPTDSQLVPIPAQYLSTPYAPTNYGGSYSATLTAPQTGTYIIGFTNPGSYNDATLSINGTPIINNPGTPPVAVYSAAVQLMQGQIYSLTLGGAGPTSNLAWALPSVVQGYIKPAVAAAKAAKVAVVVVGDDTESEAADRPNLQLPSAQDALIEAVAAVNPHTVVVVQAGAPITMPWINSVSSILDTWYPGQTDGTSLANLLYGKADPGGHLPITFPATLGDVPASTPAQFPGVNNTVDYSEGLLVGYRWYDQESIKPLFPFGYGLSYTHFTYSGLHLSKSSVDGVTPLRVTATVTNDGSVAGSDVGQLYIGFPSAAGEPPRKLVDFQRVTLTPGESQTVTFNITPKDEWWWNNGAWDESAGTYKVYVGDSSALSDLKLAGSYAMNGSIGNRAVKVTALRSYGPGPGPILVTLTPGGTQTLGAVNLGLTAPGGWQVLPIGPTLRTAVLPGQSASLLFLVKPPAGAVTENVTLFGTADFTPGACGPGSSVALGAQTLDPVAYGKTVGAGGATNCDTVYRAGGVQARQSP